MLFQIHTSMILLSVAALMLALGAIIDMNILRKTQDDRVHNILSIITIILYFVSFAGMHIRQSALGFVLYLAICMLTIGYNITLVNTVMASTLRLDKYAGRIIGLGAFSCCCLLAASALPHMEQPLAILGFLLLIYFFCRPPKQHLQVRNRLLRSDLSIISTKRSGFNYLSIVASLGLRCGAGLCLVVPIYNISNLLLDFYWTAIFFGLGAFFCGILRDRMSKYMPMISFCAICFLLVIDTAFGGVKSSHVGMALGQCMTGAAFLYYICISTDFPTDERPLKMIDKALLTFLGSIGVSIALLTQLLAYANGRTIILAVSSLSIVVILAQLFYGSIYQSHETPETSFEMRLDMFKSRHGMTVRENEVLSLVLSSEKSLKDIAGELYISISTLEKHMTSIYEKTHVKNRPELTHKFFPNEFKLSGAKAGNVAQ